MLIDTYNSIHPFTQAYNIDNEFDADDVVVRADAPVTLVYNDNNRCSQICLRLFRIRLARCG